MEQFDLFEIGRPGRPDAKNVPAPGQEINQNGAAAPQTDITTNLSDVFLGRADIVEYAQ
jgi:hypothetical protein